MSNRRAVHQRVRVPRMAAAEGAAFEVVVARLVERDRCGYAESGEGIAKMMNRQMVDRSVIAVVETDAALRCLLVDILWDAGYRAIYAATSTDTLAMLREHQPALVILDLWLECRDAGWHVLEEIWRSPTTAQLPVLVCSGDLASLQEHAIALSTHGCAVLPMPFDLDNLLRVIDAAIAADQQVLSWKKFRAHGEGVQMDRAISPDSTGDARSQTYGGVAAGHEPRLVTQPSG
jgi:DNA-binding response OmpR family regulator